MLLCLADVWVHALDLKQKPIKVLVRDVVTKWWAGRPAIDADETLSILQSAVRRAGLTFSGKKGVSIESVRLEYHNIRG